MNTLLALNIYDINRYQSHLFILIVMLINLMNDCFFMLVINILFYLFYLFNLFSSLFTLIFFNIGYSQETTELFFGLDEGFVLENV
jgi:hypothetical protein